MRAGSLSLTRLLVMSATSLTQRFNGSIQFTDLLVETGRHTGATAQQDRRERKQ